MPVTEQQLRTAMRAYTPGRYLDNNAVLNAARRQAHRRRLRRAGRVLAMAILIITSVSSGYRRWAQCGGALNN